MWVKSFEGFYVSAFIESGQSVLFHFDEDSAAHRIIPSPLGGQFTPYGKLFEAFGQVLLTGSATDGLGNNLYGTEIWKLNEEGGLELFSDIRTGQASSFPTIIPSPVLFENANFIFADARFDSDTYETILISEEGDSAALADLFIGASVFTNSGWEVELENQSVWLSALNDTARVPWFFDTENDLLSPLVNFESEVGNFEFQTLYEINDLLYANVNTALYGRELWTLKSIDGQWELVEDVSPGVRSSSPNLTFEFNGNHYFTAVNNAFGRELYRLDGEDNFTRISDINSGASNSFIFTTSVEFDGYMYFRAAGNGSGMELYRMDAQENITQVADIVEGAVGSNPRDFSIYDDILIFIASAPDRETSSDYALYSVDENHQLSMFDLPPGNLESFEVIDGNLYISMETESGGLSVWVKPPDYDWRLVFEVDEAPGTQRVINFSHVSMPGFSRDVYFGDETDEVILNPENGGIIYGGAGNDILFASDAADYLEGGENREGGDTGSFEFSNAGVVINLEAGGAAGGYASGDTLKGIENLVGSADFSDSLIGNYQANILTGLGGEDYLFGAGGSDELNGGDGGDLLAGGLEDDIINGDSGSDVLFGGEGSDTLFGGSDIDILFGDLNNPIANEGNDTLNGDGGGDLLFAGGGDDMLFGGAGSDSLFGQEGNDTLSGGADLDALVGGGGEDTFVFSAGFGNDFIIDFEDDVDTISLAGLGLADANAALASGTAFQADNGVFFNFGSGDTLMVFGNTLQIADLADDIVV